MWSQSSPFMGSLDQTQAMGCAASAFTHGATHLTHPCILPHKHFRTKSLSNMLLLKPFYRSVHVKLDESTTISYSQDWAEQFNCVGLRNDSLKTRTLSA